MNAWTDLATALERAEAASRDLDAKVMRALGVETFYPNPFVHDEEGQHAFIRDGIWYRVPPFTADLNVGLAQLKEHLPAWRVCGLRQLIEKLGGRFKATRWECELDDPNGKGWAEAEAATPALALLAAFLRAMAARERNTPAGEEERDG